MSAHSASAAEKKILISKSMKKHEEKEENLIGFSFCSDNQLVSKERIQELIDKFYEEVQEIGTKANLFINNDYYPYTVIKNKEGSYTINLYLRKLRKTDFLKGVFETKEVKDKIEKIKIFSDSRVKVRLKLLKKSFLRTFPNANIEIVTDAYRKV